MVIRPTINSRKSTGFSDLLCVVSAAALLLCCGLPELVYAVGADLSQLSLEELLNVEVTSVSKKAEPLSEAPAAIYVLTADDIRRSGYNNIPDLLRTVPGMQVAHLDLNTWAVTSRGFNGQFASKLLVMIDGRSVYSPLYSGVFWDLQDLVLGDVERIEVIRGPGATLWGANAVNGVINIITKSAQETRGAYVTGQTGTGSQYGTVARFGGRLPAGSSYRVWMRRASQSQGADKTIIGLEDRWETTRGGFRVDGNVGGNNSYSFQGNAYAGKAGYAYPLPLIVPPYASSVIGSGDNRGANSTFNYRHRFSSISELGFNAYIDYADVDALFVREKRTTIDFDLQHSWHPLARHDVMWGLGYRSSADHIYATQIAIADPDTRTLSLFSAFAQDEIALHPRFSVTLGSKVERNDYTKLEIQPNVRAAWRLSPTSTLWGAVSYASRTPSRGERDAYLTMYTIPPNSPQNPMPYPIIATMNPTKDFHSEHLRAQELGLRVQPTPKLALSIDLFYNSYTNLRSTNIGTPSLQMGSVPYLALPITIGNGFDGRSYGGEVLVEWRPLSWWRCESMYTNFWLEDKQNGSGQLTQMAVSEYQFPRHQFAVKSYVNITPRLEFDTIFRYVDKLTDSDIGAYADVDLHAAWKVNGHFEFFAAGQNLVGNQRYEFPTQLSMQTLRSKSQRTGYGGVTFRL